MGNDRLRDAMIHAHISIDSIANETGVDTKTVQRWLGGRLPHLRHRWKVAALLQLHEDALWPSREVLQRTDSEIVSSYAHRSDVSPSEWWKLFRQAETHIDMLANAMLFIPEQNAGLIEMLREKANKGCHIRIAFAHPECEAVRWRDEEEGLGNTLPGRIRNCLYHFQSLHNVPGIQMHYHETILYCSVFRGDDEMFVTQHLYGLHGSKAPLFHMKNRGLGVFQNFADHFETVWKTSMSIPSSISIL